MPSALELSYMTSFCLACSHIPILCMHHLQTLLQWNTWEMEGSRDVALMRNKEEDVEMNISCSQKPRVLSKQKNLERGAKFSTSILALHSFIVLLEKHPILLRGTNWTFRIQEPSQATWSIISRVDVSISDLLPVLVTWQPCLSDSFLLTFLSFQIQIFNWNLF